MGAATPRAPRLRAKTTHTRCLSFLSSGSRKGNLLEGSGRISGFARKALCDLCTQARSTGITPLTVWCCVLRTTERLGAGSNLLFFLFKRLVFSGPPGFIRGIENSTWNCPSKKLCNTTWCQAGNQGPAPALISFSSAVTIALSTFSVRSYDPERTHCP